MDANKWGVMVLTTNNYKPPEAIDVERAISLYDISPIIERFGQWAVTTYGMECLQGYYPIKKDRLFEGEPRHGWAVHMVGRRFGPIDVNMRDFLRCLASARQHHFSERYGERIVEHIKEVPVHHYHKVEAPAPKPKKPKRERPPIGPKMRFQILKRDGYRCQICGRSADEDGVKLHVDHKVADSKGGPTIEANLWALCCDCNIGKFTEDL